jgi:hypothetical protein
VSDDGTVHDVAQLKPIYPQGCALFPADVEQWPLAGDDLPGDLIVGESSYAGFARRKVQGISALDEHDVETEYPELAQAALSGGVVGSSAGGEFPKVTAVRADDAPTRHAIVKFSGDDDTPAVRRWSDLLVLRGDSQRDNHLGIAAADSLIYTLPCFVRSPMPMQRSSSESQLSYSA